MPCRINLKLQHSPLPWAFELFKILMTLAQFSCQMSLSEKKINVLQGLQLTSLRIQPFLVAPCRQERFVFSWQNVLSGKKQGETAVFAGYQLTGKNSHGIIGLCPMEEWDVCLFEQLQPRRAFKDNKM